MPKLNFITFLAFGLLALFLTVLIQIIFKDTMQTETMAISLFLGGILASFIVSVKLITSKILDWNLFYKSFIALYILLFLAFYFAK